jgi:hypothetical protein
MKTTLLASASLVTAASLAGSPVDPCAPDDLASIPAEGFTRHAELIGDRLFVLDGAVLSMDLAGLRVFDVADPASPALIGRVATPGLPSDIAVAGDLAFVADGGAGGLQVIDLSDPASPALVGSYDSPGLASALALLPPTSGAHHRVALADGAEGVQLVGIFGTSPDLGLTIDTDGLATDVLWTNNALFVADGWNGVVVYDLSNPTFPFERARIPLASSAQRLELDGDLLYIAQAIGGIAVLDVSDPFAPIEITEYDTPGAARGVAVSGDLVFVADAFDGLLTLDASVPPFIGIVESRDVPGAALSVALRELDAGPIAFVAANQAGVRVLNLQTCDAFCPADFAAPFGVLDLQDISAFIGDFQNPFPFPPFNNRAESLAPPEDIADLADIVVFVESFNAGCP